jgi:hypothetical protein
MAKVDVPNDLLRGFRERLFGTQQAMADAANEHLAPAYLLAANDIGKLERGVVERGSVPRRKALRTICGVETDAEIGLVRRRGREGPAEARQVPPRADPTSSPTEVISANRREVELTGSATLEGTAPTGWRIVGYLAVRDQAPPSAEIVGMTPGITLEHPHAATTQTRPMAMRMDSSMRTDPGDDGDSFLTLTRLLASQRQAVAPAALLSLVEAHRDCLNSLFRKAEHDPLRVHIGSLVAETSIVASRLWSAQGNRPMALAYCAHARQLGDDLHNPGLGATARIFESNLRSEAATLIGRAGDLVEGLRLLQHAEAQSHALGPAAQARLAAEQAQVLAVLNMRQECEDALNRAHSAAEKISDGDRTGLFSDWNASRLQVYEGTCHLLLEQPRKAVAALEAAVNGFAADGSNANVGLAAQVDLACAYAETGELDRGCDMLGRADGRLVKIGNRRGVDRAERARERLDRWSSERAVRELDERMASHRAA